MVFIGRQVVEDNCVYELTDGAGIDPLSISEHILAKIGHYFSKGMDSVQPLTWFKGHHLVIWTGGAVLTLQCAALTY